MIRFTAWLSDAERQGVRELAEKYGTSDNYIIRLAVREQLGLPVPAGVVLQLPTTERDPA